MVVTDIITAAATHFIRSYKLWSKFHAKVPQIFLMK